MATKKAPAKRKAPAKKSAAKKAPAKKAAAKKAPAKKNTAAVTQKMTKTGILNEIAENTDLSRKQVDSVLTELESLIERHIKKRAVGECGIL